MVKFSVCVPNYNYAYFLGQTLRSVLDQSLPGELEIVVSDNASTDASVEVVQSMADNRVRLQINRTNVGFAGNLDRAGAMATGDVMIMLSSDDLMRPDALATYQGMIESPSLDGSRAVISSTVEVIDAGDARLGVIGPQPWLWEGAERVPRLEELAGAPVYRLAGDELLRRSIRGMRNPLRFASTAYPKAMYEAVDGYGGQRLVNPDKWFHWRLLEVADEAYFVDRPLFAYRWHAGNQSAQQTRIGALKFLVDEYVATFQLDDDLLARIDLSRDDVVRAFLRNDVVLRGLSLLASGNHFDAARAALFARATYPDETRRSLGMWALRLLLKSGPAGRSMLRVARGPGLTVWRRLGSRTLGQANGDGDAWLQPVS